MAKKEPSKKIAASKGGKAAKKSTAKGSLKRPAKVAQKPLAAKPAPAPAPLRKSPMSRPELTEFRKLLLEKRRSILGDMSNMENEALRQNRQEGSGDLSLMPDHPANIATDNFEQEFTLGLLESERTLLKEINEALERIDGGIFGICLGTGQFIGKARLMARPWAKYCIEYARMMEKGMVRPGEGRQEAPPAEGEEAPDEEEEEAVEEEPPAEAESEE